MDGFVDLFHKLAGQEYVFPKRPRRGKSLCWVKEDIIERLYPLFLNLFINKH